VNAVVPLNNAEREELLALYQVTTQDLAFFKTQQWTLTNYGLAALAVLVGITYLPIAPLSLCAKYLLCICVLLVGVLTIFVLHRLHGSIEERRERLERIYVKLSPTFQDARGSKPRVSALEMLLVLVMLIVLGCAVALWLLTR
jgi:hypothetical protein